MAETKEDVFYLDTILNFNLHVYCLQGIGMSAAVIAIEWLTDD